MANIKRTGFGQVEPNHLSAQRTAQIYAQLPAESSIDVLENGQFVKYDYPEGVVDFTGNGEWMMVFNEVKLYDDFWRESYKDFAMQKKNYTPGDDSENGIIHNGVGPFRGQMVPRVIKTNVGDIYTTNCIGVANTSGSVQVDTGLDLAVGDTLAPAATGYLTTAGDDAEMVWEVAKVTTMPDGQAAVKLMRIK